MSLKPSLSSTELPDFLAEYTEDIAHGAIASLCVLPAPLGNDKLAHVHGMMFNDRCATVAHKVSKGFQSRRKVIRRFL